jgi:Raf kinase inhibitor-like YbhB/YbcL family protein
MVLIMDDPDAPAGTFDHWVIWNIPPTVVDIQAEETPSGIVGKNSSDTNDYFPPCPPSGEHRYFFNVYALDVLLDLPSSSRGSAVKQAMEGHILDSGELVGLYRRGSR